MKIRSVEVELFHVDGRTDMTKLTVAFRNFANAPKKLQEDKPEIIHRQLKADVATTKLRIRSETRYCQLQ